MMKTCAWAVGLALAILAAGPALAEEAAFRPIFNGENLDGWAGDEKFWRVEDGRIIGETTEENPTPGNTFLIWDQGEVDDFELRFRYRISEEANSGVQVRSRRVEGEDYVVAGYQPDLATVDWITGIHYEERGRGILARRGEKTVINAAGERETTRFAEEAALAEHFDNSEWNEYHVIGRGNSIVAKINGEKMHEVVDDSPEARRQGIIAFQLHAGPPMRVEFEDVELKRLPLTSERKKVVMIAGNPSHGYMAHENKAGLLMFKKLLDEHAEGIVSTVYHYGWPSDPTAFDNADAVVIYSNGGGGHPVLPHLKDFDEVMDRGVGLACFHYAVEVPKGEPGDYFLEWIGGYFETHLSVNPHWLLEEPLIAEDHPIGRGVRPYSIDDEWYFHMRFRENMDGVTPILSAVAPESTMSRGDGAHSGNPTVRKSVAAGEQQHVLWAHERDNGGRGFGFTGGHWHFNWGHPQQRKLALNAIAWVAGAEVPAEGIVTPPMSFDDLEANQDYEGDRRSEIERLLESWRAFEDVTE